MEKETYIKKLQSLLNLGDTFSAKVYFAIKKDGILSIKLANIRNDILTTIAEQYKNSIQDEIDKFENDNEFSILDLSSRDERSNVIYRYDLPNEEPSFFNSMREVMVSHPADYFQGNRMFNFEQDSLSDIGYFITEIGTQDNKIVIYRNNFNLNLLKQGRSRIYLTKSNTQFDVIKDDILRMDSQIDAMQIDDDFIITNLSYLDTNKEFSSIIIKKAKASLDAISGLDIVDSLEGITERLSELSFARRLMRAVDSSPVTAMPKDNILSFILGHPVLRQTLKIENGKIKLPSKKSQDAFVRLLNDDFLSSKLTNKEYETKAKGPAK